MRPNLLDLTSIIHSFVTLFIGEHEVHVTIRLGRPNLCEIVLNCTNLIYNTVQCKVRFMFATYFRVMG